MVIFVKERELYLRWLENHPDEFDSIAYKHFDDLKTLYAGGRNGIKPNERAQKILFKEEFPPESKLNVFRAIVKAQTPEEQAKLIIDNKVPYTIAVGLIDKITPTVLVALINSMSSQELINNVASLQARGAYQNPDLKALIDSKLDKAKTAKGVSALKSKTAKAARSHTELFHIFREHINEERTSCEGKGTAPSPFGEAWCWDCKGTGKRYALERE
jgi:hypothetical protein